MPTNLKGRRILYAVVALAIAVTGYAGMSLASANHAIGSGLVEQCPAVTYHC